ncbi:MAG: IS91 family transposase [Candidatus Entotheonellia bacterium]
MSADTLTLQTILQRGYAAYERSHPLPDYVRRAVWAILACRTAVLGGHVQACPEGHVERIWYNSCRHRMCPQCAWVQVERWLAKQKARLLACEHYHVIFTLPHELNELWLANVAGMTQLLFASVHDTLLELLGDAKYLGARPGIIATLHTWSQTLVLHPHIHCLVTGGGLTEGGDWVAVRHGFLLPMRVVMAFFRGKLLAAIRQGVAHGTLTLPAGRSRQQMENLLNRLGRAKWNVHIRERYPYGQGVLIYLARYLRGGPLSNRRLRACDGQQVVFAYEERAKAPGGQAQQRTMRLPLDQFIGRWLLHVPPPGAVLVRCWGLYAHTQGEALARCWPQVGHSPGKVPVAGDGPLDARQGADAPLERCPVCGQPLVCTALIPRAGAPPPRAPGWERVA